MWMKVDTRRPLTLLILALSALAWLTLWLWGLSPYSRYLSHHALESVTQNLGLAPLFVASWVVMTMAMMLPTSLPLLTLFQTITHQRRDQAWLIGLLITGYLAVWTLFGVTLYMGDWMLHRLVEASGWLAEQAWLISVATVFLAGIYQFTPLKYYCLDKCRSPMSFIAGQWHGINARREALVLGVYHGLFCLGCCWSLMLLMFAVGAGSLSWMLALGAVMAVEKNLPGGRQISAPVGVVLLVAGVALLLLGMTGHLQ